MDSSRAGERRAKCGQVVRLAEQVRQREPEVERRVAPVDHLVVEQHQPAALRTSTFFGL